MAKTAEAKAVAVVPSDADYLEVADLMTIFKCGVSKARLIMDKLPHTRIGRKYYVLRSDLNEYMATHDSIDCAWPKRKR